ncbi:hypothetical protein FWK35_00028733, partial [Aphis craccivora]
MEKKAMEDQDR